MNSRPDLKQPADTLFSNRMEQIRNLIGSIRDRLTQLTVRATGMLCEIFPAVAFTIICVVTGVAGGGLLWSWFDDDEQPSMPKGIRLSAATNRTLRRYIERR